MKKLPKKARESALLVPDKCLVLAVGSSGYMLASGGVEPPPDPNAPGT